MIIFSGQKLFGTFFNDNARGCGFIKLIIYHPIKAVKIRTKNDDNEWFHLCQSLPMGVPDERLKLRVTIDQKFRENIRLSQAVSVCQSQLTPPAKVPSSPTCSSPERGAELDSSMYEGGGGVYSKQYRAGVVEWAGQQYGEQNGYQHHGGYTSFNQVRG